MQTVCGGDAGPWFRSLGTAQPRVHPGQASVGREEAPGKPPADELPPAREGCSFPELRLGGTHELINPGVFKQRHIYEPCKRLRPGETFLYSSSSSAEGNHKGKERLSHESMEDGFQAGDGETTCLGGNGGNGGQVTAPFPLLCLLVLCLQCAC